MAKLPPVTALTRPVKAAIVKAWIQYKIRKNESHK
jgi:hypothetical protein